MMKFLFCEVTVGVSTLLISVFELKSREHHCNWAYKLIVGCAVIGRLVWLFYLFLRQY